MVEHGALREFGASELLSSNQNLIDDEQFVSLKRKPLKYYILNAITIHTEHKF